MSALFGDILITAYFLNNDWMFLRVPWDSLKAGPIIYVLCLRGIRLAIRDPKETS